MFFVDAHQDIAYNHFEFGRDFLRPVGETRTIESKQGVVPLYRGTAMLGLEDALRGQVGLVFGTLYVDPAWSPFAGAITYETPQEAHDHAMRQLEYYQQLPGRDDRIVLVQSHNELQQIEAAYAKDDVDARKIGIFISMEGADSLLSPEAVYEWYDNGLRAVGLAWSQTRYAGGAGRPGPLTALGRELLGHMQSLNMTVDLSHLCDQAAYQVLETYEGPIIASHSNPRHGFQSERLISDELIAMLAERDGVVGMVPFNLFMVPGWKRGDRKDACHLNDFVEMVDRVCQYLGNARHVGLGTDWDGGFGAESVPVPLDSIADLPLIEAALLERGFTRDDTNAIMRDNFLRIVKRTLLA